MTSMETPGDGANVGGRPITGVAGPRGCVRSTTWTRPDISSAIRVASGLPAMSASVGSAPATQPALEFEPVFKEREVGDVAARPDRLDLRHDRRQIEIGRA